MATKRKVTSTTRVIQGGKLVTKTTYDKGPASVTVSSVSSSKSSRSSRGGGSSDPSKDSEIQRLQQLQSSLKPGTFAYNQLTADINKRYSELTGKPYTPSEVIISKDSPVETISGEKLTLASEGFAATKAKQQAMAATQRRTQEALFKKFDLPGQLRREQAERNIASFADVQSGRLGFRDTKSGTSRAVTPFEAAALQKELAPSLLSSQPERKITLQDVAAARAPGRKEVFSTRTGEVLKVESPVTTLPRRVSFVESAAVVREAARRAVASKGLPPNKSFLTNFVKERVVQRFEDAAKDNPALSGIMGTIIKPFVGRTKVHNDIGLKNIDKEVDRISAAVVEKLGPTVQAWSDFPSLAPSAIKRKISLLGRFGVDLTAGTIKLAPAAGRAVNNYDETLSKLSRAGTKLVSGGIEGGLAYVDVIDKVTPGGAKLSKFVPVNAREVGKTLDKVSGYEYVTPKVIGNTILQTGGAVWEMYKPTSPEGFGNLLLLVGSFAIPSLLKGSSDAVRAGTAGERAAVRAAEARLKGALKKSKPSSARVTKVGKKYRVEKVGKIKVGDVVVPVKQEIKVTRVKPSDLKKWSDFSDYKLVGKPVAAIVNTFKKVQQLAKTVKSIGGKVSAGARKVAKQVRTKEEIYQVGNELVLRKVPLTERLFLDKPLTLVRGKALSVSKGVSESLRRAASKTQRGLQKVAKQVRTKEKIYQVGNELVLRKVPLSERLFLERPINFVTSKITSVKKSVDRGLKRFVASTKKIINDVRRKKILKIGKEVPSLRDQMIIEKLSLLEQKKERLVNAVKSIAKNSSSVQTSRTPFRVILPEVGARYVTPKLYRRIISKKFSPNLDEALKSAGLALKRFDRALDKIILDLDKGVVIKPSNESLRALERFKISAKVKTKKKEGVSLNKRERKELRKQILSGLSIEERIRLTPEEFYRRVRDKVFKQMDDELLKKNGFIINGNSDKVVKKSVQTEKLVGDQVLILEKPKTKRIFKTVPKPKVKQLKASGAPSRLPSVALTAAALVSPRVKSSLVPLLFPQLNKQETSVLQSTLNVQGVLSLQKPKTAIAQKQIPRAVTVPATSTTAVLDSVLKPLSKVTTVQKLALASSTLLLSQLIPLVRRGKPVFGLLSDDKGGFRTIHTSRVKGVNYGYLADLYSVIYGDVATAKQKAELTRPGRKFTGLEARRLIRRK